MMNDERDPRDDAAEPAGERPSDIPNQEPMTPPTSDSSAGEPPAEMSAQGDATAEPMPPPATEPPADLPSTDMPFEAADAAASEFESAPPTSPEQPAPAWPEADHAAAEGADRGTEASDLPEPSTPAEAPSVTPEAAPEVPAPAEAVPAEAPPAETPANAPSADSSFPSRPFDSELWPTEPPAAGSGDADTWPTRAPERHDEPAWEPPAHPPSEAEAYAAPPEPPRETLPDDTAAMAAAATTPAHSVPAATDVGESTQCPRCGTENRPGLAFCRNCGQRLVAAGLAPTVERLGAPEGTLACPRCGTHNRAGVAFCQNCGANLRAAATPGYVPPAAEVAAPAAEVAPVAAAGGAVLGPVVLLIGALGIVAGWLLPFAYEATSLYERAFGAGGYGAAFWNGYPNVPSGLTDQSYFGFAGPSPVLAALLVVLAIAGFMRARPGALQALGLGIALIWAVGLAALFVVVEVLGHMGGPLTELLRALTPGGIIFFLASLIVLIGTLTRFARS
jgi:hypothetical protein